MDTKFLLEVIEYCTEKINELYHENNDVVIEGGINSEYCRYVFIVDSLKELKKRLDKEYLEDICSKVQSGEYEFVANADGTFKLKETTKYYNKHTI